MQVHKLSLELEQVRLKEKLREPPGKRLSRAPSLSHLPSEPRPLPVSTSSQVLDVATAVITR